jgi:hypothetical protein
MGVLGGPVREVRAAGRLAAMLGNLNYDGMLSYFIFLSKLITHNAMLVYFINFFDRSNNSK